MIVTPLPGQWFTFTGLAGTYLNENDTTSLILIIFYIFCKQIMSKNQELRFSFSTTRSDAHLRFLFSGQQVEKV